MQAWKRFRKLDGSDRRIVVAAVAALTGASLALRLAGFRRASALLAPPSPSSPIAIDDPSESPAKIARLTYSTARSLPFACNCLERSLALCWMLRRRGIASRLRIGARKEGAQLKAHAWVESAGVSLDDVGIDHDHFVPFDGAVTSLETETL